MRLELFEDNGLQMKIIVLVVVLMSFCLIVMVMRKYATGINGLSHNRLPVKLDDEGQSDEKDPIENIYRAYIENRRKNYNKAKPKERAHLMVSEWIEYAEKTIVLEFYEFTPEEWVNEAVAYLYDTGESEIAEMMEKGIHDYHNPKYTDMCDYPEEWVDDCFEIDEWILKNKERLHKWLDEYLNKW